MFCCWSARTIGYCLGNSILMDRGLACIVGDQCRPRRSRYHVRIAFVVLDFGFDPRNLDSYESDQDLSFVSK